MWKRLERRKGNWTEVGVQTLGHLNHLELLDQVEDQDDWIHLLLLLSQPSTGGDGDETYDGN